MYSDVYHIPTQSFGEVQIWVPEDRDACIKPYTTSYPMNGPSQVDGTGPFTGDWNIFKCSYNYNAH